MDKAPEGNADHAFRRVVREKVESLSMPRLVHVAGDGLLTSVHGLSVDLVHPSPFGMEEIARNLSVLMRDRMDPRAAGKELEAK